jgi:alpha-glucosidase
VPAEHRALAVDAQEADAGSTLHFTRAMVALRRAEPALRHGSAAALDLPAPLFGLVREAAGRRVAVVVNLSEAGVALPAGLAAAAPLAGFGAPGGVLGAYGVACLGLARVLA